MIWAEDLRRWQYYVHTTPHNTHDQGPRTWRSEVLKVAPAIPWCSFLALIWAGTWTPTQGSPLGLRLAEPTLPPNSVPQFLALLNGNIYNLHYTG